MTYLVKPQRNGNIHNEVLIPEDQAELRKEVQKVKEARKEGKWAIIRIRKAFTRDRNQKDSNQ